MIKVRIECPRCGCWEAEVSRMGPGWPLVALCLACRYDGLPVPEDVRLGMDPRARRLPL